MVDLITVDELTGSEVIRIMTDPGGPGYYMTLNSVRNGRDIITKSGSGAATTVMTASQSTVMWVGAAPTTWAITLPPSPPDGQLVTIGTDTTLTTMVTVTAGGSDTLSASYASQTLTAVTSVQFVYNLANTTWYRIR